MPPLWWHICVMCILWAGLTLEATCSRAYPSTQLPARRKNWLTHCCSCTLQPPLFITPLIGKLQPDCFNWIRWKHDSTSSALRKQVCHTDIYLNKPAGNQHQLNNSSQIFILWCSEGIEILTPNIVKVNNLQTALSNEPVSEQLFTTSQILILLALQEVPQPVCTQVFLPSCQHHQFSARSHKSLKPNLSAEAERKGIIIPTFNSTATEWVRKRSLFNHTTILDLVILINK